jgi:hypothetical protein
MHVAPKANPQSAGRIDKLFALRRIKTKNTINNSVTSSIRSPMNTDLPS